MGTLEGQNKELLIKLIKGCNVELGERELQKLALWFLKSYCTLEGKYRNPIDHVATQDDRQKIMQGAIPNRWHLWIGSSTSGQWGAAYAHNAHTYAVVSSTETVAPKNKNTVIFTFGIGHLFFHLRICPGDKFLVPARSLPSIKKIWPTQAKAFGWPPGPMLNDDEIGALHMEAEDAILSLPRVP